LKSKMRIALLGGTFNPVHNGHLYIAEKVLENLKPDRVIFVPTYITPLKKPARLAAASDRLRMLRAAIRNRKKYALSDFEIKKRRKSYSIETARHIKRKYGSRTEIFMIIGSDALKALGRWKDIGKLSKMVRFVVLPRAGFPAKVPFANAIKLDVPVKNISSTDIRRRVRSGKRISHLVPGEIRRYITRHGLYRQGAQNGA